MHTIRNHTLAARDDDFGRVKDFLFDERQWTVRYMVADTGHWLAGKKLLVSPISRLPPTGTPAAWR